MSEKMQNEKDKPNSMGIKNTGSIAQIVKLAGVSASMLRKYEELGLLNPKRNEENQYRQYSSADVNRILQIRQFRKLNIPLKKIAELLNEQGSEKNIASLQQYQAELRLRMQQDRVIDAYLTHEIETIRNRGNTINYRILEPQIYQVFEDESSLLFDPNRMERISLMLNEYATAYMAFLLPDYNEEDYGSKYQVIICTPDYYPEHQSDQKYERLPGGKYAYITVQMDLESLYDQIESVEAMIRGDGYSISGRIIVEINPSPDVYTIYIPVR